MTLFAFGRKCAPLTARDELPNILGLPENIAPNAKPPIPIPDRDRYSRRVIKLSLNFWE